MRDRVWIVVVAVLAAGSLVRAQEAGEVDQLLRQLGADSSQQRQEATLRLAQRGQAARPALERATRSLDVEVALRAQQVLQFLKHEQLWLPSLCGPLRSVPTPDAVSSPPKVQADASTILASKLFKQIAQQTGNRLLLGDSFGSFHDMPIEVLGADDPISGWSAGNAGTPFWVAVDTICGRSGNHVRPSYRKQQGGLVVVTGDRGQCPVAYSGPMRGTITSVRRAYVEESEFQSGHVRVTHTFQLAVQLLWEDRLQLVAYQNRPELVSARSDREDELTMSQPGRSGWSVVTPSRRQLSFQLRLDPPSWDARNLEELRVRIGLVAVGDPRVIVLENLPDAAPRRHEAMQVTVEKLKRKDAGWEVTVHLVPDARLPTPPEALYYENQFEALDTEGKKIKLRETSHWLSDEGVRFALLFSAAKDAAPPQRLQLTYPLIRSHRDVELAWHNVPLPAGREP